MTERYGPAFTPEMQGTFNADNGPRVTESLGNFVEVLNGGMLSEIFDFYKKPGTSLPINGEIVAGVQKKKRTFLDTDYPDVQFFPDADYGITVGLQPVDCPPVWFGIVGFCPGNRLRRYDDSRREKLSTDSIIVVQMQGATQTKGVEPTGAIDNARKLFQAFRTEFVLLTLPIEWARRESARSVYVLPASKNKWMPTRRVIQDFPERRGLELQKRMRDRYDGTASRFGFERDEKGFYELILRDQEPGVY